MWSSSFSLFHRDIGGGSLGEEEVRGLGLMENKKWDLSESTADKWMKKIKLQ